MTGQFARPRWDEAPGTGILVCGLNGAGKSTLGKALAERLGFRFIDNEDLYFSKTDARYVYASPRTREEAEKRLLAELEAHKDFVFASVKGDWAPALPRFRYAVLVEVPREVRLERVRTRSFQKFGERALPGGDLYEEEASFFELVSSRPENFVAEWTDVLRCPLLRVDGERPVEENVERIVGWLTAPDREKL